MYSETNQSDTVETAVDELLNAINNISKTNKTDVLVSIQDLQLLQSEILYLRKVQKNMSEKTKEVISEKDKLIKTLQKHLTSLQDKIVMLTYPVYSKLR